MADEMEMDERVAHALKFAGLREDYDIRLALARAAIEAMPQGWQPIETAPRDGTHILAAWRESWPAHPHAESMYYDNGGWHYSYDGDTHTRSPSHWMPLPTPKDAAKQ